MSDLLKVIDGKYCIGCGACSFLLKDKMISDIDLKIGIYQPVINENIKNSELRYASRACPFSDFSPNEDEHANRLFNISGEFSHNEYTGYFKGLYAGYAKQTRMHSASGGIITWLLRTMLSNNLIDYVITVIQTNSEHPRFEYAVVDNVDILSKAGGSVYYPISMDKVLNEVEKRDGIYAFVGVPCFSKALRNIKLINPVISERIKYQIGMVCGHLKTINYVDFLIRRSGLHEAAVERVKFRKKNPKSGANNYIFESSTKDNLVTELENKMIGSNWGMGLFKPNACDFCDDIYAETSDIVTMDGWLPDYIDDYRGTSLIINRTELFNNILFKGQQNGEIILEKITLDKIIRSQEGGIRHRRRGLRYRLFRTSKGWKPRKRVNPGKDEDIFFRLIQIARTFIFRFNEYLFKFQKNFKGLLLYNIVYSIIIIGYKIIQKLYFLFGDRERLS
jgi:coenzyme F420 hydrogenase subunit beta